ncbi:5-epiaristolochene synthase [Handroanthus impetiginosus]|uniref:5-epiaristolochene synthase n=1 Tax=Handroanthus impetiginosus TaxID=429701 RepID=A0A2G9GK65_9LAMI|nr:5-epiaristolochene synthase [Handroanthus impetiginosus]
MTSLEMKNSINCQQETIRPVANFSPSFWGDVFSSYSIDAQVSELYAEEIEELKEKARNMIVDTETKLEEKLVLIDTVERLGLSYHFENEIQAHLELIFNGYFKLGNEEKDLFITSLEFRLLRQHGFDASSCIFEKFIEKNGKFKENLRSDIKGLVGLYEAAYLRYHGETILDEALVFSTTNLQTIIHKQELSDAIIIRQEKHALEQSLQRGIPRLEAPYFIDFNEEDELKDDSLLRFAKLDFILLQMLHKKELCEVSRWWKDLVSRFSYIRDRVVECYFCALGIYFEPQYSRARVILAKILAIISIIDDTYDSYGTIDELEIFTHAIERWDIKETDKLPDYMKICYKALLDLYDQCEEELRQHGRSFAVHYAKAMTKKLVREYNIEAKWFIEGHMPPFADYMANGFITSSCYLIATISCIGMNSATKEAFDWLMKQPKLQVINAIIGRILNDIGSYEIEKTRGQKTTGIECYMNEYGVSEEDAMKEFRNIAENAWKDINEEFVKDNGVSMEIMKRVVNLARLSDVIYKHNQDGYTEQEKVLKPYIIGLLVNSFKI